MTTSEQRYLVFTMGGNNFAFDLAMVAEVSEPPATWPIPSAPSYYQGAMNCHGSIVAVMDLPAFMEIDGCCLLEKLIVLHNRLASLGFLVEQVLRIVPESEISQLSMHDDGYSCGSFAVSDSTISLLDPARLAAKAAEIINS